MEYRPSKLPANLSDEAQALAGYLEDELQKISSSLIENIIALDLSPAHAVPLRPRKGMIVYADGTDWNPGSGEGAYTYGSDNAWHFLNGAAKSFSIAKQTFIASGTYTPTVGMVYCIVEGVGSGGGGGGALGTTTTAGGGGGGGSGGYSRSIISAATIGVSQTVTIGNAGVGGLATPAAGTAGSDCSLGALVVAKGGGGGFPWSGAIGLGPGGLGGVAGTGDVVAAGSPGIGGIYNGNRSTTPVLGPSGNGGSSFFGGGAVLQQVNGNITVAGANAGNYGSGGSGAFSDITASGAAGGNGSKGIFIVTEFIYA